MTLSVEEHGRGEETIVFLHGLGVSGWMWADQIEVLESHFHCLNVDLPGNGESHRQPWDSMAETADAVADVVRSRARGGRAHVVGLSLGGFVGLHLLAQHPDVVRSLLVSGVSARPFRRLWFWRPLTELIAAMSNLDLVVRWSARAMQLPEEVVPLYLRDARRLSSQTIRRVYTEVLPFELPEALERTGARVLAVAGSREARQITETLDEFPRRIPGARAVLVPDVHHAWNAERPNLFAEMVRAWCLDRELPADLSDPSSPTDRRAA